MLLDSKRGRLFVALRTAQAVAAFESTVDPKEPLEEVEDARIAVDGSEPIALALTPNAATLLVATGWGHTVEGYDLGADEHRSRRMFAIEVAREPRALTIASDGKTAFVAHAAASHLSVVSLVAQTTNDALHPQSVSVSVNTIEMTTPAHSEMHGRSGPRCFPSIMLDFKLPAADVAAAAAAAAPPALIIHPPPIATATAGRFPPKDSPCPPGFIRRPTLARVVTFPARVARQNFALAKVMIDKGYGDTQLEERILAPHTQVATGDAHVRSRGYGGVVDGSEETEGVASEVFDIDVVGTTNNPTRTMMQTQKEKNIPPVFAATLNPRCLLPRAAVVNQRTGRLYVACLGVNKVMEYDATSTTPAGTFRRAIDVAAGPSALAIDSTSDKVVVWSPFDRTLSTFSMGGAVGRATDDVAKKIAFPAAHAPLSLEAALGERLFHTAGNTNISRDGRACASCHPDGRDDGLVWPSADGPRQTLFLAGRVGGRRDAPFGWLGKHGSLKEHITTTIKNNLKGSGLSEEEVDALAAWLRVMPAPPLSPPSLNSSRSAAVVQRGRELFNSSMLQCGTCHAEKTEFSDREAHDVASMSAGDVSRQFLAPSLRFVGGTPPYFHDGRYATLADLLKNNEKMGDTKSLSQEDRDALEAYLRTL